MTDWKSPALLALGALGLLSGCSNSPPKCADSEATEVVLQIVTHSIEENWSTFFKNNGIQYQAALSDERTIEKNKDTGSYNCAATVAVNTNHKWFTKSVNITYTTERTEDSGKPYVTVYGFKY